MSTPVSFGDKMATLATPNLISVLAYPIILPVRTGERHELTQHHKNVLKGTNRNP